MLRRFVVGATVTTIATSYCFTSMTIRRRFTFSTHAEGNNNNINTQNLNYSNLKGLYSADTYPANDPIEDRHILLDKSTWRIGAVFDGHGGWNVSHYASQYLIPTILDKIANCHDDEKSYDEKIIAAFLKTEIDYLDLIRPAYQLGFGEVASVGSCVLVAMVKDTHLIVSNLGDCRAVLGHETSDMKIQGIPITHDHNARVPLEQLLLRQKHPGEDDIVMCKNPHACYVKGRLQLTRALGDAYLKYHEFSTPIIPHRSAGKLTREPFTPPYVGTIPDTFHIHLQPNDKFVILASDGLWDYLTDQQAVDIVSAHMHESPTQVAQILVDCALYVAAQESGISLEELKKLPIGHQRRRRHDDTTAVVLFF